MNVRKLRQMTARIPANIERKEGTGSEMPEQKITREINEIKTQIIEAVKAKADLETVATMQKQLDALDLKLVALDSHGGGGSGQKSLVDILRTDDSFARLMRDRKGSAVLNLNGDDVKLLERKTLITSAAVGVSTSGVLQIERDPNIVGEARQALRLRDLLSARPTSLQVIDFVKVLSPMTKASPQHETFPKHENAVTFTTASEKVQTIATWIPASKQVLSDMEELAAFINDSLMYYVGLQEELEMLAGSGVDPHLHGLIPQAAAFNTGLLTGSWTRIDVIGAAVQQIQEANEIEPTFVILNPRDWWNIRRTKDNDGRYLLGDPQSTGRPNLWDLTPVPTTNMASGTFLVGSGIPAATEIRDRQEIQLEVSTSHEDYFSRNLVAVLCERRTALITKRPNAFVYGTFTTSP